VAAGTLVTRRDVTVDTQAYEPTAEAPVRSLVPDLPDTPGPALDRGTSPRRWWGIPPRLAAVAAAVAAAVTAVVLSVVLSGGPQASHGQARTAPTSPTRHTTPASPGSLSIPAPAIGPSGSPAANPPKIPAGYSVYSDSAQHFSAAIPNTWLATTDSGGRRFCAPGGCPEVIFVQQVTSGSDPIIDIGKTSAANGSFPAPAYSNYHRLRIGQVSYYAQAAEAEFTLHKRGTPGDLHGLVRVFTVTKGGREYYVQLTALSAGWQSSLSIFGVFFATFRPLS
jgi:hypothetical protein